MYTKIMDVLNPMQLDELTAALERLTWEDGSLTANTSKQRKNNEQLTLLTEAARPLLQQAAQAVMRHPTVKTWAEPRRIARIQFARYGEGMLYASHNDAPIMHLQQTPSRTDVSFTIFLNDPTTYEGGELVLESPLGEIAIKEHAGSMVLYDTGLRHRVEKITKGTRLVVVGWLESLVRSPEARDVLRDLSAAIMTASDRDREGEEAIQLRRIRGNLLRMWAET